MQCNEEWGMPRLLRISECSVMEGARLGYPGYQNEV